MALSPGDRISVYEIIGLLGVGGMGEVYRAHDTRLGRDVAIKVLRRDLSGDTERVARLEREARVLAAVNHPHIGTIHGLEHVDGSAALVLELVEGPTLAERLSAGSLPVAEAMDLATQIAQALSAAHDRGVIHRDLKPTNIKITADGKVKVLDFGLARMDAADLAGRKAAAATATANDTRPGQVMGTVAYMSPEQSRGQVTDRRTDVWAFGCVLYEMLAGRAAFGRATVSDMIAAVLDHEPDWSLLPATTPRHVQRLLQSCLEKDVRRRRRDMGDIALELGVIPAASELTPALPGRTRAVLRLASIGLASTATIALVGWAFAGRHPPTSAPSVVEFTVYPPAGTTFPLEIGAPWPSVSPDGRQLTFVAVASNGVEQLWLRSIQAATSRALAGTEGAARPFWSPDSRSIGFFADGRLKRVEVSNGNVSSVCDAPYLGGMAGAWGAGDVILFKHVGGLFRVPASGGTPVKMLADGSDGADRNQPQNPAFLDDRHFVYTTFRARPEDGEICIGTLDSPEARCIMKVSSPARYAPPGYLMFVRDGVLRLQRFDPEALTTSGEALPVSSIEVRSMPVYRPPPFSIAADVLAFHPGSAASQLVWSDRTGAVLSRLPELRDYNAWAASPDGRWVAATRTDVRTGNSNIWVHDQKRGSWARFTFEGGNESSPVFSPDGDRIAFASTRTGGTGLYVRQVDSGGGERLLSTVGTGEIAVQDWSPDGRTLIYSVFSSQTSWDIGIVPADGSATPNLLINSRHGERGGRFSPDSKWIIYDSTESGRREVWVQPYPVTGERWQLSTIGGANARWSGDGKEIFFVSATGMMMAAPIELGRTPVVGAARPLFQTLRQGVTVSRDGQRFLMAIPPSGLDITPITVRVNWRSALEQR